MATETIQVKPGDIEPGDEFFHKGVKYRALHVEHGRFNIYHVSSEVLSPADVQFDYSDTVQVTRKV